MAARISTTGAIASAVFLGACATSTGSMPSKAPPSATASTDSTCLTQTGSRLGAAGPGAAGPGAAGKDCTAVGRSYSGNDVSITGATSAGGALRLLDPGLTVNH